MSMKLWPVVLPFTLLSCTLGGADPEVPADPPTYVTARGIEVYTDLGAEPLNPDFIDGSIEFIEYVLNVEPGSLPVEGLRVYMRTSEPVLTRGTCEHLFAEFTSIHWCPAYSGYYDSLLPALQCLTPITDEELPMLVALMDYYTALYACGGAL